MNTRPPDLGKGVGHSLLLKEGRTWSRNDRADDMWCHCPWHMSAWLLHPPSRGFWSGPRLTLKDGAEGLPLDRMGLSTQWWTGSVEKDMGSFTGQLGGLKDGFDGKVIKLLQNTWSVCTHMCVDVCTWMTICAYLHVCLFTRMYMNDRMCECVRVYVCMCVSIYVGMCVCACESICL